MIRVLTLFAVQYHIYGLIVSLHTSVFIGLPVVVLPRFTFAGFLDAIQRHTVSILYVVPPIVIMLVKQALTEKYNLSSLRFAMTGAAPMTNDVRSLPFIPSSDASVP